MQLHAGKGSPPLVTAKLVVASLHDTVRRHTHCHASIQCRFIKARRHGLVVSCIPSLSLLRIFSRAWSRHHPSPTSVPQMREALRVGSHPSQSATTSCHGGGGLAQLSLSNMIGYDIEMIPSHSSSGYPRSNLKGHCCTNLRCFAKERDASYCLLGVFAQRLPSYICASLIIGPPDIGGTGGIG